MAHEEPDVRTERLAVDGVEVLGVRRPLVLDAGFEGREWDRFDPGEEAREPRLIARIDGREGEPSVAADHGGDTVERRRRQLGFVEELYVVVRVQIDEARCDHEPVGADALRAGAVDHRSPANHQVHDADPEPGSETGVKVSPRAAKELEAASGRELKDVMFSPVGVDAYGGSGWDVAAFRQVADELGALGVTMLAVHIPANSRAEYCELIAGFGADILQ